MTITRSPARNAFAISASCRLACANAFVGAARRAKMLTRAGAAAIINLFIADIIAPLSKRPAPCAKTDREFVLFRLTGSRLRIAFTHTNRRRVPRQHPLQYA